MSPASFFGPTERMTSPSSPLRRCALALAILLAASAPALAFDCPRPQTTANVGVLRESSDQIALYGAMLTRKEPANAIDEIIAQLRQKHPKASGAEISNFLITAYCPALKAKGYGDGAMTQKVREFGALLDARLGASK